MPAQELNGILNILKPPGMTSFDVVGYLRGLLRTKKIGHTGTLDPAAAGVLPVCMGQATKAIEYMMDKDKTYRAELTLGIVTDTQDQTGGILGIREVHASPGMVVDVMNSFAGEYRQVPPMYSAVRVDGRKLYELAREGVTVERSPRDVKIYSIDVLRIGYDVTGRSVKKVLFDVRCSKGTYIRTLCADIGEKLGCGGHMSFLLRLGAGNFNISSSLTLGKVKEMAGNGKLQEMLIPVEKVFSGMNEVLLNSQEKKKFLNGGWIRLNQGKPTAADTLMVYDEDRVFLALGETVTSHGDLMLKSKKLFV